LETEDGEEEEGRSDDDEAYKEWMGIVGSGIRTCVDVLALAWDKRLALAWDKRLALAWDKRLALAWDKR
jgi:hypothetical protein